MLGESPSLSVQTLDVGREHGRVTNVDAVKDHIKTLTANGRLDRHGSGRGAW